MRHLMQCVLVLGAVVGLAGCAAMVRTWRFETDAATAAPLEVAVKSAKVKQNAAYVILRLTNRTQQGQRVEVGALTLLLADGERVVGKTSLMDRTLRGAQSTLARFGLAKRPQEPELPPGGAMDATVAFRVHRRDLRRHGELRVELSGIRVDGQPLTSPPLVLRAPPGAPRGEHI